jgi:hypothetical protein
VLRLFSYFSNNSESSRPDKPSESVEAGNISSAATVIKVDANSSPNASSTALEGDATVAAATVASQPVTAPQSQQLEPQQLQQTPVSPLTQQVISFSYKVRYYVNILYPEVFKSLGEIRVRFNKSVFLGRLYIVDV